MSTHTINGPTRQDARRLMNSALLRMACTVALSVLFALIHCVAPADDSQGLAAPAVNDTAPSAAHAGATLSAASDSFDHRVGADAHARRN